MNRNHSTDEEVLDDTIKMAGQILWSHPGGFTHEDVVPELLANLAERGRSWEEIFDLLRGPLPFIRRCLIHKKDDMIKREFAKKRGGGVPIDSLDELEEISQYPADNSMVNPEEYLAEKEDRMEKLSMLEELLGKVSLSDTHRSILALLRQGLTNEEIANELHISVESVSTRLSEARQKLARKAEQMRFFSLRSSK